MLANEVIDFIKENPKYLGILQRAVEVEEKNVDKPHWLGWEWYEVRAYPAQLVKLVIAGVTKVNFKSNSSTTYLLEDREITKQAIKATAFDRLP